jgi:hypothetical protein
MRMADYFSVIVFFLGAVLWLIGVILIAHGYKVKNVYARLMRVENEILDRESVVPPSTDTNPV